MRYTTLNELEEYNPCITGRRKLLKHLNKTSADDDQLSFKTILESNGITDAIWCLRVLPDYDLDVIEFKLKWARKVEHLDKLGSAKKCLDVVERFIKGEVNKEELEAARTAVVIASRSLSVCDPAHVYAYVYAAAYAAASPSASSSAVALYPATTEQEYQTKVFKDTFCREMED